MNKEELEKEVKEYLENKHCKNEDTRLDCIIPELLRLQEKE